VISVSAGGELAELTKERGGLHMAATPDIPMPRLALCSMVAPVLVVLFRMGLFQEAHAAMTQAQKQLAIRRDQCKPEVDAPANPARELARKIGRTIPVIHGAGGLGAVAAMRWKQSINENAKAPAFWNVLPELNHNEICAWGQHGDVTRQVLTLIALRHGNEHQRLETRMQITTELIREAFVQVLEVQAAGSGRLAQLLDLAYLGDWMSAYLALDNDVDPGPIDAIAQLKAALAGDAR
jgi:glucose/mannose-6-phosphate isomerase